MNASFWLGFIVCMVIVFIGLLFFRNKKAVLHPPTGENPTAKGSGHTPRSRTIVGALAVVMIILVGLIISFLMNRQNELTQKQFQDKMIEQRSALIESIRISSLVFLMSNILDKVDDELKNNPQRTLTDETIARIAALSYSFKPYRNLEGDTLTKEKFSPERGQLLLALSNMKIDSNSFDKIKFKTSFLGADLRGADLWETDLSGADLRRANLSEADLRGTNLNGADLRGANVWGANLQNAQLSEANLKRVNFGWADLNGADLSEAALDGVDLTAAKLRKADLSGANMNTADLSGAFLNEANLNGVDLLGTGLRRANLNGAMLKDANLKGADLSETVLTKANMSGVELTRAAVYEKNWLEKLSEWQVTGAREIREKYKIAKDKSGQYEYRVEKK